MLGTLETVIAVIGKSGRWMAPSEIAAATGLRVAIVKDALHQLAAEGRIHRDVAEHEGRLVECWAHSDLRAAPGRPRRVS